tara:strand:- start:5586 stop:6935 length:1350 start_codon:yes stop_codon:yes gene_type:complete
MDDYDVSNLYESKNEWAARLVNILTPTIIEGCRSIYNEAWKLCLDNDEEEKYLMTFQNLLARVAKWNKTIIDEETKRITTVSKCDYLEDLITCVHIVHLKALTSIRVSNKQKKVDIDIPKVPDFIHKVYVTVARSLYKNIYLFERDIEPLQYQKNMRELEVIVKESILNTVRESIPVSNILRAYIDETTEEEEVLQETVEEIKPSEEAEEVKDEDNAVNETTDDKQGDAPVKKDESTSETPVAITKTGGDSTETANESSEKESPTIVVPTSTETSSKTLSETADKLDTAVSKLNDTADTLQSTAEAAALIPSLKTETTVPAVVEKAPQTLEGMNSMNAAPPAPAKTVESDPATAIATTSLSFDNTDRKIDINGDEEQVSAPKNIERLEQISDERNEQRKLEEEEDDTDEEDVIKIHDAPLSLNALDINDISTGIKIADDPILSDIEVLS